MLPQFPRLMHHALSENRTQAMDEKMTAILIEQKAPEPLALIAVTLLTGSAVGIMAVMAVMVARITGFACISTYR